MNAAALPLFPTTKPIGRPDPDAAAVRTRSGVEFFQLDVRDVLNRCTNREMAFTRTINPYRGCEFGCTYCYARYTHSFFDLDRWQDFERKIYVKQDAARSLERALRSSELQGQKIAIGTVTDPYQPAERHYGVTRSILQVFEKASGLDINITTRSPLILRDLELLARLDRRHSITVNFTVTTLDPATARRIEPRAPEPEARLRAVRALASESIPTQIFCMPVMPGINSTESQLRPVFEAAAEYEAQDVVAGALFLRPAARKRFWPWLEREFPQLEGRYRALYGESDYLSSPQKERLLAPFEALRMAYGFPRRVAGRG
jgi:DNA repair photolyase